VSANGAKSNESPPAAVPAGANGDRALFVRWQRDRDEAAREALVKRFTPFTRSLARRYSRSSEPFDDLVQVAMLGLLKAIDRYDAERGHSFQSFAVPTVLGEMRRYFRDSSWALHVPRGSQERALKVRAAHEQLMDERGHAPTVDELAGYLRCDVEQVIDALQALNVYDTVSLDAPRPGAPENASFAESIGEDDSRYELVELDVTVASALRELPPRERSVLHMRFVEDLTQTQIAHNIGVSQMQVSRLLRRSLDQLRELADPPEQAALDEPEPARGREPLDELAPASQPPAWPHGEIQPRDALPQQAA
jgi:RNA polymerase sigma-B factor